MRLMMKSISTQQFPVEELAKVMKGLTVQFPTAELTAAIVPKGDLL